MPLPKAGPQESGVRGRTSRQLVPGHVSESYPGLATETLPSWALIMARAMGNPSHRSASRSAISRCWGQDHGRRLRDQPGRRRTAAPACRPRAHSPRETRLCRTKVPWPTGWRLGPRCLPAASAQEGTGSRSRCSPQRSRPVPARAAGREREEEQRDKQCERTEKFAARHRCLAGLFGPGSRFASQLPAVNSLRCPGASPGLRAARAVAGRAVQRPGGQNWRPAAAHAGAGPKPARLRLPTRRPANPDRG